MTTEETRTLIANARKAALNADWFRGNGTLISKLADALEAAEDAMERVPSDEQLLAALNANLAVVRKQARAPEVAYSRTLEDWSEQSKDRMRAALTAAFEAVEFLGERHEPEPEGVLYKSPEIREAINTLDQLAHEGRVDDFVYDEMRSAIEDIHCCETATAMSHDEHESVAPQPSESDHELEQVLRNGFAAMDSESDVRERMIESIAGGTISVPGGYGDLARGDAENIVDAILGELAAHDAEVAAKARGEALIEAVQAHRNLHKTYGSTAVCHGGIGGQAMTPHCGAICYNHDAHQEEVDAWRVIEAEAVEFSARAAEYRKAVGK